VNRPHGPNQRDSPADDGAAESQIDDQDNPAVRVVAPKSHDARDDVDDAGNEETDAERDQKGDIVRRLRTRLHITVPAQ
jgi:hypothetical protein